MRKVIKESVGIIIILIIISIIFWYFGIPIYDKELLKDISGIAIGTLIASVLAYHLQKSIKEKSWKREIIYVPLYEEFGRIIDKIEKNEEIYYYDIGIVKIGDDKQPYKMWAWSSVRDSYLNLMISEKFSNRINEFYDNKIKQYNKHLKEANDSMVNFVEKEFNKVGIKRVNVGAVTEETIEYIFGLGFIYALLKKDVSYYNVVLYEGKSIKDAFGIFGKHFPQFKTYEELFDHFSSETESLQPVIEFRKNREEMLKETQDIRKMIEEKVRHIWEID